MMLHYNIVVHVHSQHPVRTHGLTNQLAKKLVSLLAISPVRCVNARSQKRNPLLV